MSFILIKTATPLELEDSAAILPHQIVMPSKAVNDNGDIVEFDTARSLYRSRMICLLSQFWLFVQGIEIVGQVSEMRIIFDGSARNWVNGEKWREWGISDLKLRAFLPDYNGYSCSFAPPNKDDHTFERLMRKAAGWRVIRHEDGSYTREQRQEPVLTQPGLQP